MPKSCVPSGSQSKPRPTSKATAESRAIDIDEINALNEKDLFKAETFDVEFSSILRKYGMVASDETLSQYVFFSKEHDGAIPKFLFIFKLFETLLAFSSLVNHSNHSKESTILS